MAIKSNPNAATEKFTRRIQQAGPDYSAGIDRAQDWAGPAMAASARRDAGLQAAIADGRINAGIQRAGTAKWKANTKSKGVANWTSSAQRAAQNYSNGIAKVFGMLQQAESAVAGMDTSTYDAREQRGLAYRRAVHQAAQAAKSGR